MQTALCMPDPLAACHPLRTMDKTSGILAIDIGGSGTKASVLDAAGAPLVDKVRIATPVGSHPDEFVAALAQLAAGLPPYDRIAVGFPGMVRDGIVRTAPNLGHDAWRGYPLATAIEAQLHRPVRLANDADVQGLAAIAGKGLEMVITLGTGFGTSLYRDGALCPHLEIAHLPFRKGETFDEQLGDRARKRVGNRKWQKRVRRAIGLLRMLTEFDKLWIGGGNQKHLEGELPADVARVDNTAGIVGGALLWRS
jgi:polyphosphate glucokinase